MRVITIASEDDLWKLPIRYNPWWVWRQEVFRKEKVSQQVSQLMEAYPDWEPTIVCALPRVWPKPWGEWQTMDHRGNLQAEKRQLWCACRITCLGDWQDVGERRAGEEDIDWEMRVDDKLSRLEYQVSLGMTEWYLQDARWLTIKHPDTALWLITEAEAGRQRKQEEAETGVKDKIGQAIDTERVLGWRVYAPFTKWRTGE